MTINKARKMSLMLAYVPYILVLFLSPIVGLYSLRFVYPDIKTFVRHKQWLLSIVFGFVAYVPASLLGMFEWIVPLYSPFGRNPLLFDFEGNTLLFLVAFLGITVVNASVIEFVGSRRKTTVGVPKHVIRYTLREMDKDRRVEDITKITRDLEKTAESRELREERIKPILQQIKEVVEKDRLATQLEREQTIKLLEEEIKRRRGEIEESGREPTPRDVKIDKSLQLLREKLQKHKEMKERAVREEKEEAYTKEDIGEITNALRSLRREERGKEQAEEESKRHVRHHEMQKSEESEIGSSLETYIRAYPREEKDVLKTMVGDVRQQLIVTKEGKEEESKGEKWYAKEAPPPEKPPIGMQEGELTGLPAEEGVELFESDLSFGEGEMGGDLESLDESLDSEDFDGMFVDMGETKNFCPNCGRKGTTVVYCSSCGKPLCSNCAKSVIPAQDRVAYKCPHCETEFAMKRRMPS
jgi:hypothetical protein